MPRLKEVDSLCKLANRVLLDIVVQCCKKLIVSGTGTSALTGLQEAISAMKDSILSRIPSNLKPDFLANVMNEFPGTIVLEMIMDTEIIGLRLSGQIVRILKPEDAPRLRRLKELDLSHAVGVKAPKLPFAELLLMSCSYSQGSDEPVDLGKFQLTDLTSIKFPRKCTDSDLEIIGLNCPNLEVLDICDSESVTDAGMRFLSSCPNLRVVKVDECPKVTHESLSFLLSEHKKLEDFSYGYEERWREGNALITLFTGGQIERRLEFDMLSGLDFTLQCPSLTRFVFENSRNVRPAVEMRAVVTKFPSLTYFRIKCLQAEDLSALKHLEKLTELRVDFANQPHDTRVASWPSLQEALTEIGGNLTFLMLRDGSLLKQDDVNFIFESCPKLEHLGIDQSPDEAHITEPSRIRPLLVIPPFPKLKELVLFPREHVLHWFTPAAEPVIAFGDMLNLEILSLLYMGVDSTFLESMMLDNVKFPKLREVKINSVEPEDLARIRQTAKENNIDFSISSAGAGTYYAYTPQPVNPVTNAIYADYVDNYLEAYYNYDSGDASDSD